jgi:hypothetical protein
MSFVWEAKTVKTLLIKASWKLVLKNAKPNGQKSASKQKRKQKKQKQEKQKNKIFKKFLSIVSFLFHREKLKPFTKFPSIVSFLFHREKLGKLLQIQLLVNQYVLLSLNPC